MLIKEIMESNLASVCVLKYTEMSNEEESGYLYRWRYSKNVFKTSLYAWKHKFKRLICLFYG